MWRTAEEIQADVRSGDPEKLSAALESLEFLHDTMEPVAVAPVRAADLSPYGDALPDPDATRWVTLITKYDKWDPPLEPADQAAELARAAARFGPSSLALEATLFIKGSDDPIVLTRAALAVLALPGAEVVADHAGPFVSYLLAGDDAVRAATVDALATWKRQRVLASVIDFVEAELTTDERALVGL